MGGHVHTAAPGRHCRQSEQRRVRSDAEREGPGGRRGSSHSAMEGREGHRQRRQSDVRGTAAQWSAVQVRAHDRQGTSAGRFERRARRHRPGHRQSRRRESRESESADDALDSDAPMSLSAGDRLGPFEIVALVGEGGMGQVYRGRDAKLARDVAIKVLPDAFARDAERLARFRREAQALAALNDAHIAQIYQLEETGGRAALVMEFVDGRTIAEMLHGRPLDTDDALRYAAEIAAGLETAHEKGIIHRDLKPANVKVTPEGRVKILDFGLAKAMSAPGSEDAGLQLANSPTLTARATEAGMILGTAAYMSPEQARGKPLDKRTDIWAFGCVLFEMLTGRRTFDGDTVSDTLASVLRSDPDWSALPSAVPPHVRSLLGRCLERDVSRRLRDIGEARLALSSTASPLTSIIQMSAPSSGPIPVAARTRP